MPRATTAPAAHRAGLATVLAGSLVLVPTACSSGGGGRASATTAATTSAPAPAVTSAAGSSPTVKPKATHTPPPPPPASVKANELGLVPVLMYHRLVAHVASDYERTP